MPARRNLKTLRSGRKKRRAIKARRFLFHPVIAGVARQR